MTTLKQIFKFSLECECFKVISIVEKCVECYRSDDRVITTVTENYFCILIKVFVKKIEMIFDDMFYEIAATLLIIYFTIYLIIFTITHLRKNETILIHAEFDDLDQALINFN